MVAAAGSGQRLGVGGPKAFVELAGRPLLVHAVAAARAAGSVERVVAAVPPGREGDASDLLSAEGASEVEVVTGGASRAESVRAALAEGASPIVLIHDAARPLAPPELFDAVVERIAEHPELQGAIAAAPIDDTVKRSRRPRIREGDADVDAEIAATERRELLWAAQTPQGFRLDALLDAQRAAERDGTLAEATDEAALIERAGGRIGLVEVREPNLKVTTPADLGIAEALLRARGRV